jgi:hypothetical protein
LHRELGGERGMDKKEVERGCHDALLSPLQDVVFTLTDLEVRMGRESWFLRVPLFIGLIASFILSSDDRSTDFSVAAPLAMCDTPSIPPAGSRLLSRTLMSMMRPAASSFSLVRHAGGGEASGGKAKPRICERDSWGEKGQQPSLPIRCPHLTMIELTVLLKTKHPNLVRLYDAFFDQGKIYMALEFMDSGSLDAIRKQFTKVWIRNGGESRRMRSRLCVWPGSKQE